MQNQLERLREKHQLDEGGFTLIELLIVIVILGILAAIVVFSVAGISNTSATSACSSDVNIINTAAEAYYAQQGGPAADVNALINAHLIHASGPFNNTGGPIANPLAINGGAGVANGYTITWAPANTAYPAGNATGAAGTGSTAC